MSALTQVFVRVHFRYDRDRYAEDLEQFAAWLLAAGYRNKPARTHLFHVQQVLNRIGAPPGTALSTDALVRAFRRRGRRASAVYRQTHTTYTGYLRSVDRLVEPAPPPPDPLTTLVQEFCERLTRRRGLARSTVAGYDYWVTDFLKRMLPPGRSLTDLTAASLESYIARRGPGLAPRTLRTSIKCVQAFLRDCHERGRLPDRIDVIDLPRGFRYEQPPRALPWRLVKQLLSSIDRSDRTGRRDHAALHLMAHYGLRTGELAHLTLDSIDWKARTLTVYQSKTYSTLVLPLHDRTLRILSSYLELARPQSTLPWLFLSGVAPAAPMNKYSLSQVFRTRARRSGLPIAQYSSYSLRHAFALRLFQRGVGMKAIGDLMGHRSFLSTSAYIRLQADVLREVALPVPGHHASAGGVA